MNTDHHASAWYAFTRGMTQIGAFNVGMVVALQDPEYARLIVAEIAQKHHDQHPEHAAEYQRLRDRLIDDMTHSRYMGENGLDVERVPPELEGLMPIVSEASEVLTGLIGVFRKLAERMDINIEVEEEQ